jgi:hypothetical protein
MKKVISLFLFLALFLAAGTFARAQEKIHLVVGPVRQEVFVDPGQSDRLEMRFYNQSEQPIAGTLSVVDFVVTSPDGAPTLLDDPDNASPKFSGASWVSLPYYEVTIAATNRVSVPLTINVPENAKPGGRYVAVYFQPGAKTPQGSTGTGVTSRVAGLLYIRVNGDIAENAIVTRFQSPGLIEYGPVNVNTEILNRGDYHITPNAVVAMTNAFGTLTDQVSLKEQNIFPDAVRLFSNEIGPKWLFGRYKLTLMGAYGASGKALEAVSYTWIIPWRVIAVVILATILLYILIKKLVTGSHEQVAELEERLSSEEKELEQLKKQLRKRNE